MRQVAGSIPASSILTLCLIRLKISFGFSFWLRIISTGRFADIFSFHKILVTVVMKNNIGFSIFIWILVKQSFVI